MGNFLKSVRAVCNVNVALSGLPASTDSDDVVLADGDRVLLTTQVTASENGIWEVASAGAWARPSGTLYRWSIVYAKEGMRFKNMGFALQSAVEIVVDTDPQIWTAFTQPGLPPGWINVREFGAEGDGVTDDSAAFASALASFPGVYTELQVDGTLYVPPGNYKLSEDLWVSRGVRILGAAGFGYYTSCLHFDLYKGIYVADSVTGPKQNDGFGAIFENLYIQGSHKPFEPECFWKHPKWTADQDYAVGDRIVQNAPRDADDPVRQYQTVDHYYECIQAGHSGLTEPAWETTLGPNYGFTDAPALSKWTASAVYTNNSTVWVDGRYDVIFVPHDTIYGVTAGTDPSAMLLAAVNDVVSDGVIEWVAFPAKNYIRGDVTDDPTLASLAGEPIWAVRKNAGIRVLRRCKIDNCLIDNFLSSGIDLAATHFAPRASFSIGTQVDNVQIRTCGGGILTDFTDSGASFFQGVDITGSFDLATQFGYESTKEFGICDRGQLGSTYIATQIAEVGGPHIFQTDPSSTSAYIGLYTEGDNGAAVFKGGSAMVLGGNIKPVRDDADLIGIVAKEDWRGVGANLVHPLSQGASIKAGLAKDNYGAFSLEGSDNSGAFGWIYNMSGALGSWSLVGGADPTKTALRVGTIRSNNTSPFILSIPRAYFLGEGLLETLITMGGGAEWDTNIRGGRRLVGDRNIDKTQVKANTFLESVVVEDGFRGSPNWLASSQVETYNRAVEFMANDNAIERDGYVYRVINSGYTGTVEPIWPTTVSPFPGIQVWNGPYNVFGGAQASYKQGDIVRPTVPNGFVYTCTTTKVGAGGVLEGKVGTVEPTWGTALGLSNPTADNEVNWICSGLDVAASYVDEAAVGGATWVCVGKLPVYGKANFIHQEGSLTLAAGAGPVTGVIDLGPLPNDQLNVYRVTVRAQNIVGGTYAYFELEATWDAAGGVLEAPSVARAFPSPMLTDWSATLQLNGSNHVEVAISQDGAAPVTFTAIRAIF